LENVDLGGFALRVVGFLMCFSVLSAAGSIVAASTLQPQQMWARADLDPPVGTVIRRESFSSVTEDLSQPGLGRTTRLPGTPIQPISQPAVVDVTIPGGDDGDSFSYRVEQSSDLESSIRYSGLAASGLGDPGDRYIFNAYSQVIIDAVNDSGGPGFLSYNFSLDDLFIEIRNGQDQMDNPFENALPNGEVGVRFRHVIGDGDLNVLYDAEAEFWTWANDSSDNKLRSEFGALSGFSVDSLVPITGFGGFIEGYTVNFAPLQETIPFGLFDTGERKEFLVRMEMPVLQSPGEVQIEARMADPGNASLTFTPAGDITPVPLPAAGWMLLAAIGGLCLVNQRRKTVQNI
jgi:hypothetical protein